ncbi:MAG: hypothetical protein WBP45_03645 [Daejeonella sp.]
MPELSNIQTFEKIEGSNFKPTLERFCKVLKNIELWNDKIKEEFENFKWKVEDNGFVYSSITQLGYYASKLSKIKIRPYFIIYTYDIDGTFKDNWICCELLINTEELQNIENGQFHNRTYELIKDLAIEMQKEFKQTGIYFTDEVQDAEDFEGIRYNDFKKLWQFDYALIPVTLNHLYSNKPKTHTIKKYETYFEAWHNNRWKTEC